MIVVVTDMVYFLKKDVWYELRHSFTTAETHRQLVNLHYDIVEKSTTIFFIGSQIGDVQRRIHQIFTGIDDGLFQLDEKSTMNINLGTDKAEDWSMGEMQDVLEDPFSLITIFMNLTFNDLFTIQADFDVRVWDQVRDLFHELYIIATCTVVVSKIAN